MDTEFVHQPGAAQPGRLPVDHAVHAAAGQRSNGLCLPPRGARGEQHRACQRMFAACLQGGRRIEQFEDNLKSVELKLTPDDVARLDKVSQPPLIYPYWHQSFSVTDRMSAPDLALHAPYIGS